MFPKSTSRHMKLNFQKQKTKKKKKKNLRAARKKREVTYKGTL